MRLDKYLKISRIIKRRTVANEACDNGHVSVNGRIARASLDVSPGDTVEIAFGRRTLTVRILNTDAPAGREAAGEMFEVLSDKAADSEERQG
ncbi:MAG: RNA-binding S4 domain-containing protein [Clostridia bacterium]|nr:RNA-binding S4 domain-containing protein [Clostridia bacterium]